MSLKYLIFTILPALLLCACSSGKSDTPERTHPELDYHTVFPYGVPEKVGRLYTTKDKQGRIASVGEFDDVAFFTYHTGDSPEEWDITMTMRTIYHNMVEDVYHIYLNEEGFARYAVSTKTSSPQEFFFEYDAEGRLLSMIRRRNGSDETKYEFQYDDGDISMATLYSDGQYISGQRYYFLYGDAPIENRGGLTLYYSNFCVDMRDFRLAYWTGMLGRGPKHLPAHAYRTSGNVLVADYSWRLNEKGLPTALISTSPGHTSETLEIVW